MSTLLDEKKTETTDAGDAGKQSGDAAAAAAKSKAEGDKKAAENGSGDAAAAKAKQDADAAASAKADADKKAAADKAIADAAKKRAPEAYALKLPEKTLLKADHVKAVEDLARKLDLPQDQAQALVERDSALVAAHEKAQLDALAAQEPVWRESARKDQRIAGADGKAFDANLARAQALLEKHSSPALREILSDTGYGSHPEFLAMLVSIGASFKEDELVNPGAGKGKSDKPLTLEEGLYGRKA